MPALDTIDKIAHQLLLHNALPGLPLARVWAANSFSRLADLYDRWSWRTAYGQFNIPEGYSRGTVSITTATDPTLLTFSGSTLTPEMVGRSIQIGDAAPQELVEFLDAGAMRIAIPWGDADVSASAFEIFQQYVTGPEDLLTFISVIDPTRNQQLRTGVRRAGIDRRDPRRTSRGNPWVLAEAGLTRSASGTVDAIPFVAAGSGSMPGFGGNYIGPSDTVYIVEVLSTGIAGVATFRWRRGSGAWSASTITDEAGNDLTGGVIVNWPTGATYTDGDIFVTRARVVPLSGLPRFEVWPAVTTQCVLPYYYVTLPPDATAAGFVLPRIIRGDVVLKGAMAEMRGWAGRGSEANPMYDLKGATKDLLEFERMVDLLTLRDDELYPQGVSYMQSLPYGGQWDASWEQVH